VAVKQVSADDASIEGLWARHFSDPRRERALLAAGGFTTAFGTCRAITHMIRAEVGPFHNLSAGGRHLHHSTFGIFGLLATGYVWTYRWALGSPEESRWLSRVTATSYGIAGALTLDEFALWFDLQDDYWTKAGRKSIDATILFGGLLTFGVAGRGALRELTLVVKRAGRRLAHAPTRDGG
jgi:hypothetical protein